jgi:hypothetical protein
MQLATKYGGPTLIGLLISLPLVYWVEPSTGAGTTLLVVIVLLATNAIGCLFWRIHGAASMRRPPSE